MVDLCLGFEVHQPYRTKGSFRASMARGLSPDELSEAYLDQKLDRRILERVCRKCYLPANRTLLEKIDEFQGTGSEFKVVFSISGVLVEQLERWQPDVLDSFRKLSQTGKVEMLDQTYHHSLASLYSRERTEFRDQVELHRELMHDVFQQTPKVFENTEFIYNDSIAASVAEMGYQAMFTEGAEKVLDWRSPNHIYRARHADLSLLLRNYRLSDDIAFRFSTLNWPEWPLTAEKYASWLSGADGDCVTVFIDYETLGEHQWPETGILDFLKWLPREAINRGVKFRTASELVNAHQPVGEIEVGDFDTISWADEDRSTNAWLGNDMQRTCFGALRSMESQVRLTDNQDLMRMWRVLQISDHLYYMYTEEGASGLVHGYFSAQPPVKSFWSFSRILSDFHEKIAGELDEPQKTAVYLLRILPPDQAFHFHDSSGYLGLSAHSLEEFQRVLSMAPEWSVQRHQERSDISTWVGEVVGDSELAQDLEKRKAESAAELKIGIFNDVQFRIGELRELLRS